MKNLQDIYKEHEPDNFIEPSLYPRYRVKQGLRNDNGTGVKVGLTKVSQVVGYKEIHGRKADLEGKLIYRGYSVDELVSHFDQDNLFGFEQIAFLLIFGALPTKEELESFHYELLTRATNTMTDFTYKTSSILNAMQIGVLKLYGNDENPDNDTLEHRMLKGIHILSSMPLFVFSYYTDVHAKTFWETYPKPDKSFAENILYMARENRKYTKKEVEDFMIYLREWQEKISTVYAYGLPVMKKVIELLSENRDVIAYTNNGILECMKNDDVMTYLKKILGDAMLYANSSNVTSQKTQACKGCIGYYLYMSISDMTKINSSSSDHNIEFYQYVSTASQVITSFLESTKKQKDLIIRLPKKIQDIFLLDKLYSKLSKCEQFYSLEEVSDLYSYISEYENYHERLELLKELQSKEQTIINDNEYNILINRRNTLENKISTITDEITTDKFTIEELNDDLKNYNKKLNENKEIRSSLTDFSIVESEYNDMKSIYDKMVEQTSELNSVLIDIKSLVKEVEKSQKQLEQNHYAIKEYKELKKNLKKYNKVYDDLETLRMALSSKEGIPLVFIQMYLANTKDIANELLNIVFNGSIEIDNFEITANDFLIPYIKNGKKIKDVKSASQGELSFFQLAISFALNYQSISKYNIMLLDEIDGGLDPINREKFIQILDHQIEMINAEQVFLITHNEMFNTDDVDVIDLTPGIPQKESRTLNVIVKKK